MNSSGSIPYTPVNYAFPFPKIRAQGTLAAIGSCFAQDIAMTLLDSGMRGMINPNGILYNPYSINDALQRLECGYTESDFFELNGLWHSWRHHGAFSAASAAEGAASANESAKRFRRVLKKADFFLIRHLFIGSPWPAGNIVENNLKDSSKRFLRLRPVYFRQVLGQCA